MLITQNGEAKLVVMDVRLYDEQEETPGFAQNLSPRQP